MDHLNELEEMVSGRIAIDEPMSRHTTLGVGGPADYLLRVHTEAELCDVMSFVSQHRSPWMVVGDGTNLLVSDKGIRGIVIRLEGALQSITVEGATMTSGAGATISRVADVAAQHDLTGLEGVGTVPGTAGGAVVMNAGTHRGYIDAVTDRVTVVTENGQRHLFSAEDCRFTYRNSRFQRDKSVIITSVMFALAPGDGSESRRHLEKVRAHRANTQPPGKSAGCFFKNLECASAGQLIEEAGAKGMRVGGAIVSDIHANFIVNTGNATASELRDLAEKVRTLVRQKHGTDLEYEVRLVGEW